MLHLLRSDCRFAGRRLFFGKAILYPSHIRLTGWSTSGRYRQSILLADVERVGWYGGPAGAPYLLLHMSDGATFALRMSGAAMWRLKLDELLRERRGGAAQPFDVRALLRDESAARPYRHRVHYGHTPLIARGDGMRVSSAIAVLRTPGS